MTVHRTPLCRRVIGCAIEVHSRLGPGLLESAYETCLAREFALQRIIHKRQVPLPVEYKGISVRQAYRVDFVVEDELLLEIKSIDYVLPVHRAQLFTYLKLLHLRQGLLLNFKAPRLIDGLVSVLL